MSDRLGRARVYQAVVKTPTGYRQEPIDWAGILEDLRGRTPQDTTTEGTIFAPAIVPDGPTLLGMHTPIDTRGWTSLATDAPTVEDLLVAPEEVDEEDEGEEGTENDGATSRFARSSVVLPLTMPGYFAIASSGGRGPGTGKLKTFLSKVHGPKNPQDKWEIRPVMDESRLEEFLGAGRARSFTTSFPVDHNLMSLIPEDEAARHSNLFKMGRQVSDAAGASLLVEVTISLAPEAADNVAAQRALADEVRSDPERLIRRESGAHAETVLPSGEVVDLNLVPDAMARSFPLERTGAELLTFRHTCKGLADLADVLNADVAARHAGD